MTNPLTNEQRSGIYEMLWIPLSEKQPPDFQNVLIKPCSDEIPVAYFDPREDQETYGFCLSKHDLYPEPMFEQPTHWMEIPR